MNITSNHFQNILERRTPVAGAFQIKHKKEIEKLEGLFNRNVFHIIKILTEAPDIHSTLYGFESLKLIDHAVRTNITCIQLFKQFLKQWKEINY